MPEYIVIGHKYFLPCHYQFILIFAFQGTKIKRAVSLKFYEVLPAQALSLSLSLSIYIYIYIKKDLLGDER
jgi:hypothetical protein